MADDKTEAGGQDRSRINVHEDYELRHWAQKFGVSTDELKAAVRAVGSHAPTVERHLIGRKR